MFVAIPLMIVPFVFYNAVMLGSGLPSFAATLVTVPMLSGALWTITLGDVVVLTALAALFFEVLKATMSNRGSLINHMLSMLVFVVFLVEFLLVRDAATQLFFTLMVIAFIDVVAGFTISNRAAGRDVSIGL
ncbi:hypothetical protein ASE36_16235 [Rhizobium sp. Root274]|uniref:hypothetical protein n=1 Tax=unclassified Rhizobium TaxID=2613769 RepID=UPI000715BF96|nr:MULTISPECIES: hypothetical protein [unclassified Rhizobium]KQW28005.1 hypothetical protein ASC71_16270 [Rhizobium sp. Root1240]KRD28289.1 hypothetical protein ASE36_16235 [Rhizobium sp. Root274]